MSRRERISDFTRPVSRPLVSDSRRVISRESLNRITTPPPSSSDQPRIVAPPKVRPEIHKPPVARTPQTIHPAQPRQVRSAVLQRQGLKKLPAFKPRKTHRIHYRQLGATLGVILVIGIIPLVVRGVEKYRGSVKGTSAYSVSDDMPRYFTSSSMMNVAAKVRPISTLDDSASTVMNDASYVGWYEKSSKPGQPGTMVMAGYPASSDLIGAFSNMERLKEGSTIQVETGDGRLLLYKVSIVRKYDSKSFNEQEATRSVEGAKEGLNLVSFLDKVHPNSELGKYRYVAFAVKEDN